MAHGRFRRDLWTLRRIRTRPVSVYFVPARPKRFKVGRCHEQEEGSRCKGVAATQNFTQQT
jgi:hypothetical protein